MGNIKTYNNILTVLEDIATRHYQVNSYGVGDNWEIGASEAEIGSTLWVNPVNAFMKKGEYGYAAFEVAMNLKVFDLVDKDESNENDVHSDSMQILQDIVTEFTKHPYYTRSKFDMVGDLTFIPFTERFDDEVTGWEVDILIRTPNQRTFCGIPVGDITDYSFPTLTCTGGTIYTSVVTSILGESPITVSHTGNVYTIGYEGTDNFTTGVTLESGTTLVFDTVTQADAYEVDLAALVTTGTTGDTRLIPLIYEPNGGNANIIPALGYNGINAASTYSSILGGKYNSTSGPSDYSVIFGGKYNLMGSSDFSVLGGLNSILTNSNYSTVFGGKDNTANDNSHYSVLGGGFNSIVSDSTHSVIGGGQGNEIISSNHSTIAGGNTNTIEDVPNASIIGSNNTINHTGTYSSSNNTVLGNNNILTSSVASVIGGGDSNSIISPASFADKYVGTSNTISGGYNNKIGLSSNSVIGGGINNQINGGIFAIGFKKSSVIGGGYGNIVDSAYSTIGGGYLNQMNGTYSFIGGGKGNTINSVNSSIIGGQSNDTAGYDNVHIIGSNMTATTANTTYVNSLHIDGRVSLDMNSSVVTTTATTLDLSVGNMFTIDLSGSTELDYTNPLVGTYQVIIDNQTTGSTLTFAATQFKAAGGTAPTLTATSGATDMLSMTYDGSDMIIIMLNDLQTI